MFGLGSIMNSVVETVEDFVEAPVETTWNVATAPVRDTFEILEGLSEGELRERAILRLGVDVVAGMAISEVIEVLLEEE